jgi:hypothetical protein
VILARVHFPTDGSGWRDPYGKPLLLGFGCPEGFGVGSGVSEVTVAFVTTPATVYGSHDDRALRLDGRSLGISIDTMLQCDGIVTFTNHGGHGL